jgi:hypothetical protein
MYSMSRDEAQPTAKVIVFEHSQPVQFLAA